MFIFGFVNKIYKFLKFFMTFFRKHLSSSPDPTMIYKFFILKPIRIQESCVICVFVDISTGLGLGLVEISKNEIQNLLLN